MSPVIPAHRSGSVDVHVLSALAHIGAYIASELRADDLGSDTAWDLHRWVLGALSEAGAQVGRGRHSVTTAQPFTDDELNHPRLLDDLAARRRAAVEAFDAEMLNQGAEPADLPALRDHYQPAAEIAGAFLDRLIATLCALEARCRDAAAPRPATAGAPARDLATLAAAIFAALVLIALRTLDTTHRDHPPAHIEPTAAQAVTLTRAARAPGAVTSA